MTFPARHLSVSIGRPATQVYAYASDPANLPNWAAGLSGSIRKVGDDWVADSPMGQVKVRFVEKNAFGVLDHDVTLPTGAVVTNPMRVVANGSGSELSFTLFKRPEMSQAAFEHDAASVARDLKVLKAILET